MNIARVMCRAQVGMHAPLVHVEVHLGSGLPTFAIVGLAAPAVKESKERVRSALVNSKFEFPAGRITVSLAPADVPKDGGRFDLPIAVGIAVASGQLKIPDEPSPLDHCECYGELALNGELKPATGMLVAAVHAAQAGHDLIVPSADADEACIAAGTKVRAARHLAEVCAHLQRLAVLPVHEPTTRGDTSSSSLDLLDICGQLQAKRALAVAAAGNHSLLLIGPPGAGKSMLAQRLPGLLPPLTDLEALEVAQIASASIGGFEHCDFRRRPFRAPHHTASVAALVGGGAQAAPGEISLAHRGVLFLDELPEFDRRALEALREPMESGSVFVSRVAMQAEYPSEFQLIAAMNPCPCGYRGDPSGRCDCAPGRIAFYKSRVSGPLLDRIDLRIEVPALAPREISEGLCSGESTAVIAERVREAQAVALARTGRLNSRLTLREIGLYCRLGEAAERLFWQSQATLGMSARSYHHALRVARTIADLDGSPSIDVHHVCEALQLRRGFD